ncbi:MAG TPA: hypothetical protein VFR49_07435, partial [Solirubrobacteraceae bacterium]|nr:hypothetical protein [Solirubrobacteraceae bacterium]
MATVALVGGLPAAAALAQTHHKHAAVKHRVRHHRRPHAPTRVAVRPASVQAASAVAAPTPPPSPPVSCAGTDLVPTDANLREVDAA